MNDPIRLMATLRMEDTMADELLYGSEENLTTWYAAHEAEREEEEEKVLSIISQAITSKLKD